MGSVAEVSSGADLYVTVCAFSQSLYTGRSPLEYSVQYSQIYVEHNYLKTQKIESVATRIC